LAPGPSIESCDVIVVINQFIDSVFIILQDGVNYVKKIKGVFCFKIQKGPNGQEGLWIVDAKNGTGAVKFGAKGENVVESNRRVPCVVEQRDWFFFGPE
jgi:hypothetical protein